MSKQEDYFFMFTLTRMIQFVYWLKLRTIVRFLEGKQNGTSNHTISILVLGSFYLLTLQINLNTRQTAPPLLG